MIYLLSIVLLFTGIGEVNESNVKDNVTTVSSEQIKPCGNFSNEYPQFIAKSSLDKQLSKIYAKAPSTSAFDLTVGDCFDYGCLGRGVDCVMVVTPGGGGGICYKWLTPPKF